MKSDRSIRLHLRSRKGFTLLEIIIAVTIVALLSMLVVPKVMGVLGRRQIKQSQGRCEHTRTTSQPVHGEQWNVTSGRRL